MKKIVLLFALSLLSSPLFAGVRYTLRLQLDESEKRTYIIQNSWLQGEKARISFDENASAESEVDADHFGTVAYSIDPQTRRATRLSLPQNEAKLPIVIENIMTTKTLQEAGPLVLGHPTIHYRFRSEFDYTDHGFSQKGVMDHDLWVASDLADSELMHWMMFAYKLRRDRGIESLFREVSTLGLGLPLAYDGIARIQLGDGNTKIMRVGAVVESLEKVNVDPSVFSATANTFEVVAGGK